jgi:hypothetical protein
MESGNDLLDSRRLETIVALDLESSSNSDVLDRLDDLGHLVPLDLFRDPRHHLRTNQAWVRGGSVFDLRSNADEEIFANPKYARLPPCGFSQTRAADLELATTLYEEAALPPEPGFE